MRAAALSRSPHTARSLSSRPRVTTSSRSARAASDLEIVREALLEEYEVLEELGRGGMGIVYRGRDRALDRAVAIKVLPFGLAHDELVVERFQREARTAAQLEHPHIVPIHRVGRAGPVIYFVMKLLQGTSLAELLRERGALSGAETRRVLCDTASALGAAHRRGIVHRDMKPDNVLRDEDGRWLVTDFGIARSGSDSTLTAAGTSVGTPRYMSPEQARGQRVDARSDIYSLGVVGYQCLTGRLPFDGEDPMAILLAHVTEPPPHPAGLDDDRRAVYAVVERMLSKDPAMRPQHADEVIATLQAAQPLPAGSVDPDATARHPVVAAPPDVPRRPRLAGRIAHHLTTRSRVFWLSLVSLGTLGAGAPVAVHFATGHRSRCEAARTGFTVMVDGAPASVQRDLDVYYDVCGLTPGTAFTTRVVLTRQGVVRRRSPGGAPRSSSVTYQETASGPAIRRHRSLTLRALPAGTYSVSVVVEDDRRRRRAASTATIVR